MSLCAQLNNSGFVCRQEAAAHQPCCVTVTWTSILSRNLRSEPAEGRGEEVVNSSSDREELGVTRLEMHAWGRGCKIFHFYKKCIFNSYIRIPKPKKIKSFFFILPSRVLPWSPGGRRGGCRGRRCSTWSLPCSPGRPPTAPWSGRAPSCPHPPLQCWWSGGLWPEVASGGLWWSCLVCGLY